MKIFVSSTFTDMDVARDVLNKQVRPRLSQKMLEKYGQEIDFTDFRWGINTENTDNSAVKTMLTCLEAVDEAAPPMPFVILLGDRCSRPLAPEIIVLAEKEFSFTVENKQCGITELEIEYGALRDEEHLRRAVICYIAREGTEPEAAMQALRRKLDARLSPDQILRFVQTEEGIVSEEEFLPFGEVLTEALWRRIDNSLVQPDEDAQENIVHRAYMEKKAMGFRSRHQLFDTCMQAIAAEVPVLFLTGETGAGKSSLLSRLLLELRDGRPQRVVRPVFCGLTEHVDTGMEVLRRIVRHLEDALGREHVAPENFDAWKDYEEQLCIDYEVSDLPRMVIGIDAVDQLRIGNVAQEMLFLPYGTYRNVQFIVSFTPDIAVPRRLIRVPVIKLECIDEQETREIIRGILSEYNKRELAKEVEDRLVSFCRDRVPLELNLAVQALRMMDATEFDPAHKVASMEGINRAQLDIIDRLTQGVYGSRGHDLLSLSRRFLQFACERIDERLYTSLRHIAAAPYGLTVEMLRLLDSENFNEENFLLLRHYLQEVFILRADGRYDFAHKCLRQALFFVNLSGRPDDPALSRRLFDVLYELDDKHPVRVSDILYFARQCKQYNYITDYIVNAFWSEDLQYRRAPIRLLLKDGNLRYELINNLPNYLACAERTKEGAAAIVREKARRLYRFNNVFGSLFAQEDCDTQEDVNERDSIYGMFISAVNCAISSLGDLLKKNRDELTFELFPYWALMRDWFVNCARYNRYSRELSFFASTMLGSLLLESNDALAIGEGRFFTQLSPEDAERYSIMDRAAFKQQFFVSPESTFRQLLSLWLYAGCRYDLERLFDDTDKAEKSFICVFKEVLNTLYRQEVTFDIKDKVWEHYEAVYARAKELDYPMMTWREFVEHTHPRSKLTQNELPEDALKTCAQLYRDLEYKESTRKYTAYFEYVTYTLSKLFAPALPEREWTSAPALGPAVAQAVKVLSAECKAKAIACCRDAINAAERALQFTNGRMSFFDSHSNFCRILRELLSSLSTPACLAELQETYERQFALILDSGIFRMNSMYTELLGLEYPQRMISLYESAGLTAAAEDQQRWHYRVYTTVIRLLNETDYDPIFKDVRRMRGDGAVLEPTSFDDESYDWDAPLVINDAHSQLLFIVLRAVNALYAINGVAAAGFDELPSTAELYDDLEVGVLSNFEEGSTSYPASELKARIDALRRENAYPAFTDLLGRLDEALTPPPTFGISKAGDSSLGDDEW